MCINLSYENKIYLSRMRIRLSRTLDKMNDSIVYAVEEFDKKYTEFGGIIVKKFNMWKSGNSRGYRYTSGNSSYMSPSNSSSRISPFEIITTEIQTKQAQEAQAQPQQAYDTQNVVINVEDENPTPISRTKSRSHSHSQEMVDKHFIDNTESFLDDAWDIINGND
jgi:hypothetical protein